MTAMPVLKYGAPELRQVAAPIDSITPDLATLAHEMGETMYANNGIGLAGNQVGVLRRILVLDVVDLGERGKGRRQPNPFEHLEVYLNPEIVSASAEDESYTEGCLSLPGIEGAVWRPVKLRLRWMDLEGKTHEDDVDGMRARVLQHEIDHLDGKLFIDHLPEAERVALAGKLSQLRKEQQAAG